MLTNTTVTVYVGYEYTHKARWKYYLYARNYTKFSPNKDLGLCVTDNCTYNWRRYVNSKFLK